MSQETVDAPPVRAGRREWWGLALLAVPAVFINFDLTVLFLALPQISESLAPSSVEQLWIVDIYAFMVAGFMITMGSLGDRVGRRNLLMIGSLLFGLASLGAAFSTSVTMLIVSRTLLGIGAATYAPSSLALLRTMFQDAQQRSAAVGIWMGCFMGGSILGPVFGGVILSAFPWGAVFLPAVPVMALVLVVGRALIPEYRSPDAGKLDLVSTALSLAGILLVIWAVKRAVTEGWDTAVLVCLVVGAAVLWAFVARQQRISNPMVDLGLFRDSIFRGAFLLSFVAGGVIGGALMLVNLYMQTVNGFSPLKAGLLMAPTGLALIVGIALAQGFVQKFRPASVIAGGMVVSTVGFLLLTQLPSDGSTGLVLVAWALAFSGMGPAASLGYDMILASTPAEKAGSASGTVEASGQLGTALGIAVLGTLATGLYQARVTVPAGLDAQTEQAVHDSVTRAEPALLAQGGPSATRALDLAHAAFTGATHVVFLIAAVAFLLMAVFAAVALRSYRAPVAEERAPEEQIPEGQAAGEQTGEGAVDQPTALTP